MAADLGNSCAGDNTIAALVAGAADASMVHRLHAHLDTCASCRQLVADLGRGLEALEPSAMPAPGERLGRYVVRRLIGVGGMGVVYEAHDATLERRVAIKLVRPDLAEASGLYAEARAMAKLAHPNIAAVFDVGRLGDQPYICMEYVAGGTLREWLAAAPRSPRAIIEAFVTAGRGLAYVHRRRLVHLDFKPDNVLVEPNGRIVVSDFGLAALVGRRAIAGTPAYMAPEQRRGEVADARADQYAFCVALAESLGDRVPRWARRAIARGRHADRELRFASMDELLARLEAGLQLRRRRATAVVIATAAASLAIAVMRGPALVAVADGAEPPRVVDHWLERDRPALSPGSDLARAGSSLPGDPDRTATARARELAGVIVQVISSALETGGTIAIASDSFAQRIGDHACDDGSELSCSSAPPECPPGTAPAIQSGCWTCADATSCSARGIPHACDDGSPLRCTLPPPNCAAGTTASVRGGCWTCADPFACTATSTLHPQLAAYSSSAAPTHGIGTNTPPATASPPHATTTGSDEGSDGSGSGSGIWFGSGGSGSDGSNYYEGSGSGVGSAACGNGFCETGEDHASCPSDCCALIQSGSGMTCAPVCGNGFCEIGEAPASCPADCCGIGSDGSCI